MLSAAGLRGFWKRNAECDRRIGLEQLGSVWRALSLGRRVAVVAATVGVFAAVLGLGRMASTPTMSLLYAGLEPSAAAEVIASLEGQGATFDVRGSAIYVESVRRDALRIALAGEGLPVLAGQGYELLETLTGFGTTAQMFDATYWRAKEGELARTISSNPLVKSARVHIANPGNRPFQRGQAPSAAITVTTVNGTLSASHGRALKFLVASAVAGLIPENVTVVDGNGSLVATDGSGNSTAEGRDRAEAIKQRVERLVEARVGYGNSVVEVSLDTETVSEQIVERTIDPDSRVAISTDTTETKNQSTDSRGGAVTVASNLPDGDAEASTGNANSSNTETRERTNFEVSETQREVVKAPGAIKRISVAVLVDGLRENLEDGSVVWAPRDPAELETLRSLVAAAVGYDEARGDEVTIQSLEFSVIEQIGTSGSPSLVESLGLDVMALAQTATLAVVALGLGLIVIRPILLKAPDTAQSVVAELAPPIATTPENAALKALDGEIDPGDGSMSQTLPALPDLADLPDLSPGPSGAVDRLKQMISDREDETAEILQSWMEASPVRSR